MLESKPYTSLPEFIILESKKGFDIHSFIIVSIYRHLKYGTVEDCFCNTNNKMKSDSVSDGKFSHLNNMELASSSSSSFTNNNQLPNVLCIPE